MQTNTNSSTKQANGDISAMPPPPNPRTRVVPFPAPIANVGPVGYNLYATQQQQFNQLRHAGEFHVS